MKTALAPGKLVSRKQSSVKRKWIKLTDIITLFGLLALGLVAVMIPRPILARLCALLAKIIPLGLFQLATTDNIAAGLVDRI